VEGTWGFAYYGVHRASIIKVVTSGEGVGYKTQLLCTVTVGGLPGLNWVKSYLRFIVLSILVLYTVSDPYQLHETSFED
jgi:hypothetical protein